MSQHLVKALILSGASITAGTTTPLTALDIDGATDMSVQVSQMQTYLSWTMEQAVQTEK